MSVVINNVNVECMLYLLVHCGLILSCLGSRVLIPDRSSDSGIMTVDSDDVDCEYAKINRL